MYTVWISAVIGLILAFAVPRILAEKKNKDEESSPSYEDKIWIFGFKAIFGPMFGFLIGMIVAFVAGSFFPTHQVPTQEAQLVSLRNGETISGSFFLGTGMVNGQECYFYFKEVGTGFVLEKLAVSDDVTIYEEDRGDGKIVTLHTAFADPQIGRWVAHDDEITYAFYIPKGSIKKDFNLQ